MRSSHTLTFLRHKNGNRNIMGLQYIVRETPEAVRAQERWLIPSKL